MSHKPLESCLRLKPNEDRTVGTLVIEPGYDPAALTPDAVDAFLDSKAIKRTLIDEGAVEALTQSALAQPAERCEREVVRGTPPTDGEPGRFEWSEAVGARFEKIELREIARRHAEAGNTHATNTTDDKAVDFYNQSAFVVVRKGERIGQFIPPVEGEDGEDIFGNSIPAKAAIRAEVVIGANLRTDGNGVVYASAAGQLEDSRSEISVNETLDVNGFVDFSTGNIDFPGDVHIHKGVRPKFTVACAGNCHVGDLVEAATFEVGGDLTFTIGVAGHEQASITCRGNLHARYLEAATVTVEGSCTVDREITHCDMTVTGTLDSPNCVLRGGTVAIRGRCAVSQIGSENGVETELILGRVDELDRLLRELDEIEPLLADREEEAKRRLAQITNATRKLTPGQAEQLTELQFLAQSAGDVRLRLNVARDRMCDLYARSSRTNLYVAKLICPKSAIVMRGYRLTFSQTVKGPLDIDIDPETGQPRLFMHGSEQPRPLNGLARIERDRTVFDFKAERHEADKAA